MNADVPAAPISLPEWKRSGPFLILAILLHGLALAWPLARSVVPHELQPAGPLVVSLVEPPVAPPASLPPPALPPAERPFKAPRPVIAVASKSQALPSPVATPAEPATPSPPAAPAAENAPPAVQPALTPARYNAAYLHNPEPVFPPLSRRLGEEGKVLLRVKVSADGQPVAVDLEKSSNFERLDEAARRAVARWRFVPARRGDEPVEGAVIVPIVFRLDD